MSKGLCYTRIWTFDILVLESKKAIFCENWRQLSMPMSKMGAGNSNVLSNHYQETQFQTVKSFNYTIDSQDFKKPKTRLKNYWALVSHYIKSKHLLKKPFFCKLPDKLCPQFPKLYYSVGLPSASPNAIWKQINIPTILRWNQSLSENGLVLIIPLKRVILHLRLQLNLQVQGVQVPLTPKP